MTRTDHRPAILRALDKTVGGRSKSSLVAYLGAQDAWDAIDRDLQKLRRDGLIAYRRKELTPGFGSNMWALTEKGKEAVK